MSSRGGSRQESPPFSRGFGREGALTHSAGDWISEGPGALGRQELSRKHTWGSLHLGHFTSCSRQPDPGFWPSRDLCRSSSAVSLSLPPLTPLTVSPGPVDRLGLPARPAQRGSKTAGAAPCSCISTCPTPSDVHGRFYTENNKETSLSAGSLTWHY